MAEELTAFPGEVRAVSRTVASVDRVGTVLDAFSERPEWGVTELAGIIGMSKSGLHRILTSMVDIGLLLHTPESRYRLGWRSFTVVQDLLQQYGLDGDASLLLGAAARRCGETLHLGALDRGKVVYLAKAEGATAVPTPSRVGSRLNAHCSAIGKLLMAHQPHRRVDEIVKREGLPRYTRHTVTSLAELKSQLEAIRRRGGAVDLEESIVGVRCVAAPVRDHRGDVVAAVSVAGAGSRFDDRAHAHQRLAAQVGQRLSAVLQGCAA